MDFSAQKLELEAELARLRAQNESLHNEIKQLMVVERRLLESENSRSKQTNRIRALNDFALAAASVEEISEVEDLACKMLLSAFSLDIVVSLRPDSSGYLKKVSYRLRVSKRSLIARESVLISADQKNKCLESSVLFTCDELGEDDPKIFCDLCRKILAAEEEDVGFDQAHKVLVAIPQRRKNGALLGLLLCLSVQPNLNSALEEMYSKVPNRDDLEFIGLVKSHMEAAIEKLVHIKESHARGVAQTEIEATKSIQERLLPAALVALPNVSIATHYQAAASAGGDWFGYTYDIENHALNIYIGDVTGHGVSSAVITGVACGAIYGVEAIDGFAPSEGRTALGVEEKLRRMAAAINRVIFLTGQPNKLMTMAFLSLQLDSGELTYLNFAHPPLFVVGREKGVRTLLRSSPILGTYPVCQPGCVTFQLEPGDSIFAYTDGLVENQSVDGRVLGYSKLSKLLAPGNDVQAMHDRVLDAARKLWQDRPLKDDVTLAAFQWAGPVSREAVISHLEEAGQKTLWGIQYRVKTA